MARKRMTQLFPFLLTLRKKQRNLLFFMGMRFDKNHYARSQSGTLWPYKMFESSGQLYNRSTGFDMVYQENKVFNLKLAAKTLDTLLIRPGETFSFWQVVCHADQDIPYKEGLVVTNGQLAAVQGGGMCQMSNLLFWLFLHTPLTIVERHTHNIKDFPDPPSDTPMGVDATISQGWLDLKVKNETNITFQIHITFDQEDIIGSIFTDRKTAYYYEIENRDLVYFSENAKVFQQVSIYQSQICCATGGQSCEKLLYKNLCEIGYQLPENIQVIKKGE